jgi:phosphoglycerol transferase MdoB-like AlkP superfamily enzyme
MLDLIVTIVLAVILFGATRWLLEALIQALISLFSAFFSAAGAIVLIGVLIWLLNSVGGS